MEKKEPVGIGGLLYIPFFYLSILPGRYILDFMIYSKFSFTGLTLMGDRTEISIENTKMLYKLFYETPGELFYGIIIINIFFPLLLLKFSKFILKSKKNFLLSIF